MIYQFYRDNRLGTVFSKEEVAAGDAEVVNEEMLISGYRKEFKRTAGIRFARADARSKYMCCDSAVENNEIILL